MILASGTGKRVVYPNTILGFHTLEADEDDLFGDRYLSFWEDYAKLPESWLSRRDDEMLYFTAKEAIEYGIADVLFLKRMIKPTEHSRYISKNIAISIGLAASPSIYHARKLSTFPQQLWASG